MGDGNWTNYEEIVGQAAWWVWPMTQSVAKPWENLETNIFIVFLSTVWSPVVLPWEVSGQKVLRGHSPENKQKQGKQTCTQGIAYFPPVSLTRPVLQVG